MQVLPTHKTRETILLLAGKLMGKLHLSTYRRDKWRRTDGECQLGDSDGGNAGAGGKDADGRSAS